MSFLIRLELLITAIIVNKVEMERRNRNALKFLTIPEAKNKTIEMTRLVMRDFNIIKFTKFNGSQRLNVLKAVAQIATYFSSKWDLTSKLILRRNTYHKWPKFRYPHISLESGGPVCCPEFLKCSYTSSKDLSSHTSSYELLPIKNLHPGAKPKYFNMAGHHSDK
jgi:hypothetical protein